MGAAPSRLHKLVSEEFQRLRSPHRSYLVLDDILKFQLAHDEYRLDLGTLGVLLAIDRERSGRFDLVNVLDFARQMNSMVVDPDPRSMQTVIKSSCELQLWREIMTDSGIKRVSDWVMLLIRENNSQTANMIADVDGATTVVDSLVSGYSTLTAVAAGASLRLDSTAPRAVFEQPGVMYFHKQTLIGAHKVLTSKACSVRECDMYNNELQRAAEAQDLLSLSDASLDDWVPEPIVRDYVMGVLVSMRTILSQLDVLQRMLLDNAPQPTERSSRGPSV